MMKVNTFVKDLMNTAESDGARSWWLRKVIFFFLFLFTIIMILNKLQYCDCDMSLRALASKRVRSEPE